MGFQPLANKNSNKDGSLSITLTVSDGITADDFIHTFELTVTADNHAPVVGGVVGTSLAYTDNGDNVVLTLNGMASLGLYQAVLRTVTYRSSSEDPTVNNTKTSRSINWEVTDVNSDAASNGAKTSTIVTSTINITAVNDAPLVTGTSLL